MNSKHALAQLCLTTGGTPCCQIAVGSQVVGIQQAKSPWYPTCPESFAFAERVGFFPRLEAAHTERHSFKQYLRDMASVRDLFLRHAGVKQDSEGHDTRKSFGL